MDFINTKKYSKIKEMADAGDERAKEFLFDFMEMSDEDANAFLAGIDIEPEQNVEEEWKQVIEALIEDENEAIDGYDKAIKYLVNVEDNKKFVDILNDIKEQEIEHIQKLKELL